MARILLLEEANAQRHAHSVLLSGEGHRVQEADCVAQFAPRMLDTDIALIDVDLPGGEGYRAAGDLQRARPEARIMMLTAHASMADQIKGLRGGADQYLIKPVAPAMLSAYVATMARRVSSGGNGWRLDRTRRQLCAPDGHTQTLTTQEMSLMALLFGNANRVVTRRMIAAAFDTDWLDFDERRLDQTVSRLRRRWRDSAGVELPLCTEHRRGYSFRVEAAVN